MKHKMRLIIQFADQAQPFVLHDCDLSVDTILSLNKDVVRLTKSIDDARAKAKVIIDDLKKGL